jgi:competence ComEA-like helix-hairpin-helix protein
MDALEQPGHAHVPGPTRRGVIWMIAAWPKRIDYGWTNCHRAEDFPAYRHTAQEYQVIVYRMGDRGAWATTAELNAVANYLAKNSPKIDEPGKMNVNNASAKEIETGLNLTAAESEAIVKYREKHGDFRVWGDLLVIYGVDGHKIQGPKAG